MVPFDNTLSHALPIKHDANFRRPDIVKQPLYVIAVIFNPIRYRSRWNLYKKFENYVLSNNEAFLLTVECAFGDREHVFMEEVSDKHRILHVTTKSEIWLKENLINLGISRLPYDWKYAAWIDCDIQFARPDWVGETIQQLQHYDIIQMFSEAHDIKPNFEILASYNSFMSSYINSPLRPHESSYTETIATGKKYMWHPGYCWAITRKAFEHIGGLIDYSIIGNADRLMADALIGILTEDNVVKTIGKKAVPWIMEFQNRCLKHINKNVGYMSGAVFHYWHGKKVDRQYELRTKIITDFDPVLDLKRDYQGLYQLTDRNHKLRDDIRKYNRARNEDSIDL